MTVQQIQQHFYIGLMLLLFMSREERVSRVSDRSREERVSGFDVLKRGEGFWGLRLLSPPLAAALGISRLTWSDDENNVQAALGHLSRCHDNRPWTS